jgi:GNAT superfamily N-acetyltransferase
MDWLDFLFLAFPLAIALREIDAHTCEMKRLFVYTHLRGKGIGKALVQALIERARAIGYQGKTRQRVSIKA